MRLALRYLDSSISSSWHLSTGTNASLVGKWGLRFKLCTSWCTERGQESFPIEEYLYTPVLWWLPPNANREWQGLTIMLKIFLDPWVESRHMPNFSRRKTSQDGRKFWGTNRSNSPTGLINNPRQALTTPFVHRGEVGDFCGLQNRKCPSSRKVMKYFN